MRSTYHPGSNSNGCTLAGSAAMRLNFSLRAGWIPTWLADSLPLTIKNPAVMPMSS